MTSKDKHQKHAKIPKPNLGDFGRNELGFMGTSCGVIQGLAREVIESLSSKYKLAYVDADHKEGDRLKAGESGDSSLMQFPDTLELRDKIVYKRLDMKLSATSVFDQRQWLNRQDLVLINANHFIANIQILIIDPKKSLEKKLDRLTDVQLILLAGEAESIPDLIKNHLKDWENIPCFKLEETPKITAFIEDWMQSRIPPVYGLVLAGGKSIRMNQDKGTLEYHGKNQREHTRDLLLPFSDNVFISCNQDQEKELAGNFPLIVDNILGMGPMGGLISAFMQHPDAAWLTLACDLPFMDLETIEFLVNNRNPSKLATAFLDPKGEFPEPLITIWEPRAYPVLYQFLSQGYSCPRKVLINTDIELLKAPNSKPFHNVNNPEEYKAAFSTLQQQKLSKT